jgi:ketosteroid isomerase-like protein
MRSSSIQKESRPSDVAKRFIERVNAHDVDGLVKLMTEDHTFVDSMGDKSARPAIEDGWRQYFEMVPDYWIRIDRTVSKGDTAILIGTARGTYVPKGGLSRPENRWETPAVWVAQVRGGKIAEWRIYSDNEPIRARMRSSTL